MSNSEGSEISPCLQVTGAPPCQGCRPETWDAGARHSQCSGSVSRHVPWAEVGVVHTGREPASGNTNLPRALLASLPILGPEGGVIGALDSKSVLLLKGEVMLSVLPGDLPTASLERAAEAAAQKTAEHWGLGLSSKQVCTVSSSRLVTHSRCCCGSLFLISMPGWAPRWQGWARASDLPDRLELHTRLSCTYRLSARWCLNGLELLAFGQGRRPWLDMDLHSAGHPSNLVELCSRCWGNSRRCLSPRSAATRPGVTPQHCALLSRTSS